jgi:hypothetical protein
MERPYNFDLAELLDQHFVAPQCFEPDEVFAGQLDRYKTEIEDLFADADDPKTKLVTAGALARIDQSNDELVLPVLMAGLEGEDKTQLAFAASCLMLGPLSLPAMPLLIKLLRHEDEYVAYEAAKALGRIGKESIPHLIKALDCVTTGVGDAAAIALGDRAAWARRTGLFASAASPTYVTAVTLWSPADKSPTTIVAVPPFSVILENPLPSTKKSTPPVGGFPAALSVTVTVKVTSWP